jgi:hypothetical protein
MDVNSLGVLSEMEKICFLFTPFIPESIIIGSEVQIRSIQNSTIHTEDLQSIFAEIAALENIPPPRENYQPVIGGGGNMKRGKCIKKERKWGNKKRTGEVKG